MHPHRLQFIFTFISFLLCMPAFSQNVGIGTPTPNYTLEVVKANGNAVSAVRSSSANASAVIKAINSTEAVLEVIKAGTAVGGYNYGWVANNMGLITNSSGSLMIATPDSMAFSVNNTIPLRIRNTGEIVINGNNTNTNNWNSGYLTVSQPGYYGSKPTIEMNSPIPTLALMDGNTLNGYLSHNGNTMELVSFGKDMDIIANTRTMHFRNKGIGLGNSTPNADLQIESLGTTKAALLINSSRPSMALGDTGTLSVFNNYTGSDFSCGIYSETKGEAGLAGYFKSKNQAILATVDADTSFSTRAVQIGISGGKHRVGLFVAAVNITGVVGPNTNRGIEAYANGNGVNAYNTAVFASAEGHSGANNRGLLASASNGGDGIFCLGNGVYTGTWTQSSDFCLKEDIQPLGNSLQIIKQLQPASYHYKTNDAKYKSMNLATGLHYGLIAQELEKIVPALVKDNLHYSPVDNNVEHFNFKSVNYIEMIPLLIKGMQEQQAIIENLQQQINQLKKGI